MQSLLATLFDRYSSFLGFGGTPAYPQKMVSQLDVSILPLTLIVPVRSEIKTLPSLLKGLDSLASFPSELIFVMSGFDDGSAELIENWMVEKKLSPDLNHRALNSVLLPGAARNLGVNLSSEPWVAFIDAGIVPHPDWLSQLWACKEQSGSLAVYGSCHFYSDQPLGRIICALSYGQSSVAPVLPASLFSRGVFDQAGFFDERLRSGEDIIWKGKLQESGVIISECRDALVEYRHFPNTLSGAIKKWFVYEKSATQAGLRGPCRLILQLVILVTYAVALLDLPGGLPLLAIYLLARGVVDPIRRSKSRVWWRHWWQPVLAIPVAAALDLAAAAGRISAVMGGGALQEKSETFRNS